MCELGLDFMRVCSGDYGSNEVEEGDTGLVQ